MNAHRGDAIKERPILFPGPEVRAILDGRKTQDCPPHSAPHYDVSQSKRAEALRIGAIDADRYLLARARCGVAMSQPRVGATGSVGIAASYLAGAQHEDLERQSISRWITTAKKR